MRGSPLVVLLLLASACGDDGSPDGAGLDAGRARDAAPSDAGSRPDAGSPPDAGSRPDAGAPPEGACYTGAVEVEGGAPVRAVTPRYELVAQVAPERAEELARILEATFPAFEDHFGYAPAVTTEPLVVKLFADEAAFRAGLLGDGVTPPASAGGYFDPSNGVAYLFVQPTRYFTDTLLIHEAAHQFQSRGRAGSGDLPAWYGEGAAEHLGRHDWDGACVRLGVRPLLTLEDYPARALEELERDGLDLAAVVDGEVAPSRPVAMAVYGFLASERGAAFRAFRDEVDGGRVDVGAAFREHLGPPDAMAAEVITWLRGAQLPMTPTFLEWAHVDATTVDGWADVFTIAPVKRPVDRFSVRVAAGAGADAAVGVVLGLRDTMRWTALVVRGARVETFEVDGGARWVDRGAAPPLPAGGARRFEVAHGDGEVTVTVDGEPFTLPHDLPRSGGLALNATRARFEGIAWE